MVIARPSAISLRTLTSRTTYRLHSLVNTKSLLTELHKLRAIEKGSPKEVSKLLTLIRDFRKVMANERFHLQSDWGQILALVMEDVSLLVSHMSREDFEGLSDVLKFLSRKIEEPDFTKTVDVLMKCHRSGFSSKSLVELLARTSVAPFLLLVTASKSTELFIETCQKLLAIIRRDPEDLKLQKFINTFVNRSLTLFTRDHPDLILVLKTQATQKMIFDIVALTSFAVTSETASFLSDYPEYIDLHEDCSKTYWEIQLLFDDVVHNQYNIARLHETVSALSKSIDTARPLSAKHVQVLIENSGVVVGVSITSPPVLKMFEQVMRKVKDNLDTVCQKDLAKMILSAIRFLKLVNLSDTKLASSRSLEKALVELIETSLSSDLLSGLPVDQWSEIGCTYLRHSTVHQREILKRLVRELSGIPTEYPAFIRTVEFWNHFMIYATESDVTLFASSLRRIQVQIDFGAILSTIDFGTAVDASAMLEIFRRAYAIYKQALNADDVADRKAIYRLKSNKRLLEQFLLELSGQYTSATLDQRVESVGQMDLIIQLVKINNEISSGYNIPLNAKVVDLLQRSVRDFKHSLTDLQLNYLLQMITSNIIDEKWDDLLGEIGELIIRRLEGTANHAWLLANHRLFIRIAKHFYRKVDYGRMLDLLEAKVPAAIKARRSNNFILMIFVNLFEKVVERPALMSLIVREIGYETANFKIEESNRHVIKLNYLLSLCFMIANHKSLAEHHPVVQAMIDKLSDPASTEYLGSGYKAKVYESFIQRQIYSLFQRLGLSFTPEKKVGFTQVDIFVEPNIIVEILGDCHFYFGEIDNYSKVKKTYFNMMGYKTFYCTDGFLKVQENKARLLTSIQKAIDKAKLKGVAGKTLETS